MKLATLLGELSAGLIQPECARRIDPDRAPGRDPGREHRDNRKNRHGHRQQAGIARRCVVKHRGEHTPDCPEHQQSGDSARGHRDETGSPLNLIQQAETFARIGRVDKAQSIARSVENRADVRPTSLASLYVALGDRERAFDLLERAINQETGLFLLALAVEPAWDPVRNDRRFGTLLRRLGL